MVKRILSAFAFLIFSTGAFSQSSIYLGTSLDFGVPQGSTFGLNKGAVASHILSYHLGGNLSVQYRWKDRISIEAGVGQSYDSWRLRDKQFENRHDGFIIKFMNRSWNWNYFANISFTQEIDVDLFLYAQFGYAFNNYTASTLTKQINFQKATTGANEDIEGNTTYAAKNNSYIPEIGIQKYVGGRHMISAGVKMHLGNSVIKSGNYSVVDVANSNSSLTTDSYSSKGSWLGFTVKYSFLLHHIPKKEKPPKKPKEKPEPEPEPEPVVVEPDPEPEPEPEPVDSTQYNEREIEITHKVKVHQPTVTIKVWDHQMVDGDRISLNLNGTYVLEDYTLAKRPYEFDITLEEGTNRFVLHALNLGRFEPNTAAVVIKEGDKEHKIILESTLERSGTIEITYKPEKEKKKDKEESEEEESGN